MSKISSNLDAANNHSNSMKTAAGTLENSASKTISVGKQTNKPAKQMELAYKKAQELVKVLGLNFEENAEQLSTTAKQIAEADKKVAGNFKK